MMYESIQFTVEPPNKGHLEDNINSAILSFVEMLSSFIEASIILLCPYLGGSTSTVVR